MTLASVLLFFVMGTSAGRSLAQPGADATDRVNRYYTTSGVEWFLSHASACQILGAFLTDRHALELRYELMYAGSGRFDGRSLRVKSFWSAGSFYTTLGIHSYEATIVESVSGPDEPERERKSRNATSGGIHGSIGSQWHFDHLVLGIEYVSIYHAVLYKVEGKSFGSESEAAVERSRQRYRLNWPLHTPQIFIGLAI